MTGKITLREAKRGRKKITMNIFEMPIFQKNQAGLVTMNDENLKESEEIVKNDDKCFVNNFEFYI